MFKAAIVVACATAAALGAYAAAGTVAASAARGADAVVAKGADGHYWARAEVGGRGLDLLVDTGAGQVALTPADARALGLDPSALTYSAPVVTAAGRTRAAPVMLASLSVGDVEVTEVQAVVVPKGLERSLLGMSFLGRLKRFSADAHGLTLTR